MENTRASLQAALEANLGVQRVVEKKILSLGKKKKRNREEAAKILARTPSTSMLGCNSAPSVNRPWANQFFVDQKGSTPLPNVDSILRKSLQKGKSFSHESPLWGTKEVEALHQIIHSMKEKKAAETPGEAEDKEILIDFEDVASKLNLRCSRSRSAEECRVKYQPNRSRITKEEHLILLKQFHNREKLSLSNGRTKWQSFSTFRTFHGRNGTTAPPWTLEEDEVLFRAIAAAGPQQVVDQYFSSKISPVLKKTPKAILQRTMNSLLNPKYINDAWSDYDERKLCLLMKIYRDCPSPFCNISSHFPFRGSRSVHDKWNRTLNPNYDLDRYFTKDEDRKLLQVKGDVDWKKLESEFPGRKSQTLSNRWRLLASEGQILQHCQTNLKRKLTSDVNKDDVVIRRVKHSG